MNVPSTTMPRQRTGIDPILVGMREFEEHQATSVRPLLEQLARDGQHPQQLFITCADSRVVPNLITSSGPGDLFCVRNIGNLVPRFDAEADASVGAAIEFAVDILHVKTIVVCGHSDCGAMLATLDSSARPGSRLHNWLRHAEPSLTEFTANESVFDASKTNNLPRNEQLCLVNVNRQLDNLRSYPSVAEALDAGELTLVGMYFDIAAAQLYLVDPKDNHLALVQDVTDWPSR